VTRGAKITSKGQITVPREVRQALGVGVGDKLFFENLTLENGENAVLVRPARGQSAFSKYRGIGNPGIRAGRQGIADWIKELRGE
jgi:AbrB family looped-hinge helix DNA binding protein